MKKIVMLILISLLSISIISLAYADIKDDADNAVNNIDMEKMANDAKQTINSGQDNVSKEKSSKNINESNSYINNFSGGGDKNVIATMLDSLISDKSMKSLDGKKEFSGQILCDVNSEIGRIKYNKNSLNNKISMTLEIDTLGSKTIGNISSICPVGVQSREGNNNYGYSYILNNAGKLDVAARPDLQDCRCIDSSCNYSATENDYDILTGQVIQFLSSTGIYDVVTAAVENSTSSTVTVKISSQSTQFCGSGNLTNNNSYGYVPTDSLYRENKNGSVSIPDGTGALMSQLGDENSIYSLLNKSTEIEYETGVKMGSGNMGKCSIKNSIIATGDKYISDGGCEFNVASCSSTNLSATGYNECINYYEQHSTNAISETVDAVCGKYEIHIERTKPLKELALSVDGKKIAVCDVNSLYSNTFSESKKDNLPLTLVANTCDNSSVDFTIKIVRYYKVNRELSLNSSNECITYKSDCGIVNETICDDEGKNCTDTIKNLKLIATPPKFQFRKNYNDIDYNIEANGSAIVLTDDYGNRTTLPVTDGNAYFLINREYSCPESSKGGLKNEQTTIDHILGGINNGTYDDMKTDDCSIPICLVTKLVDDRSVVNNETGETRVELGNSLSAIDEVRTCELAEDKFSCPANLLSNEKVTKDCSCDTDILLDGIGNTLAGLETLKQLADISNRKCGK